VGPVPPDPLAVDARLAAHGDHAAFERLVRATNADVWRMCSHLANRDVADDLTQETYLRAWRGLRGYRGDSSARTWLLAIARRVAADHLRSTYRSVPTAATTPPASAASSPDDTAADDTAVVDIEILIAGLDDDRRLAIFLTQHLGLSYAEAAAVCDCPIGTIRSRVARARQELVEALRIAEAQ
jgi:RNA polymerase sigma-70 factor (ECF subfamily)